MKALPISLFIILFSLSSACFAQETFEMKEGDTTYIMQQYFMVFLYRGEEASKYDSLQRAKIQEGHLAHLNKLAEENKISIAGPFGDNTDLRGIVIFHVATLEEAKALEEEDPAVKAGVLRVEVRPWWAAKGSTLK